VVTQDIILIKYFDKIGFVIAEASQYFYKIEITGDILTYLTTLRDEIATYIDPTTVTINAFAAVNPLTFAIANVNEFNVYINGQYIDKACYTWTPSDISNQTIVFDTNILGFTLDAQDVVVVNGRWA
jgi:hypothetical protein